MLNIVVKSGKYMIKMFLCFGVVYTMSTNAMIDKSISNRNSDISSSVGKTIELERTFLAKYIPNEIKDVEPKAMVDTYFPDQGHAELRVRQKGDRYEITKKIPLSGVMDGVKKMQEMTIPLTQAESDALTQYGKRKVLKNRYNVVLGGYPAEVDVFQGQLSGLVMIDFEFNDLDSARNFVVPEACLADVSKESFKAGGVLAGKSYQDIENDLKRFDYKPLF